MGRRKRKLERVASLNLKVGRGLRAAVKSLRELIADHDPDAIVTQESQNYRLGIRLRFLLRWRTYYVDAWPESGQNLVLARRSLPRGLFRRNGGWGAVRNRIPWTGPKHGWAHAGRTWTWAKLDDVPVMSLHRVGPRWRDSAPAFREEGAALVEWARAHPGPFLILGDHNHSPHAAGVSTSRWVAEQTGARVASDPHEAGIDYAIVRGLAVSVRRVKRYGSDHRAVIVDIRRRRDTLREAMS